MPALDWSAGRKLNWREEGSGPAMLLVHGSPADGRAWNRVVPFLKDRFRLVTRRQGGRHHARCLSCLHLSGRVVFILFFLSANHSPQIGQRRTAFGQHVQ